MRIGGTEVILRGGARTDRDYLDLLKTRPAIGTVLNHSDYDGFKSSLTRVALRKGYFDSEFNKSQLGVSLDRHQAFWDIDYNSGERYRFGPVTFEGSQIRDEYLQNLVPFKQGDYYTSGSRRTEPPRRQPAGLAPSWWRRSLKNPARPKFCLCRAWSLRVKRIPLKPGSATQPTSGRASKAPGESRG